MTTESEMELRAKYRARVEGVAATMHLAAIMAQLRPKEPAMLAAIDSAVMEYIGRRMRKIVTDELNNGRNEKQEKRYARLTADAAAIAAWYGLTVEAHCDPRGCGFKLHHADRRKLPNTSLGGGFCVG